MTAVTTGRTDAGFSPRLRLTRRGRVVFSTLLAAPLIIGALVFGVSTAGAVASGDPASVSFSHVTVQQGDSLWRLAGRIAPKSDPREVVAAIVDLNQLESSTLQAGEKLAVPSQYAH